MIPKHQPSQELFPPSELIVAVSSRADGNMGFRVAGSGDTDREVAHNRQVFLREQLSVPLSRAVLNYVTYDRTDFTEYRIVQNTDLGFGMNRPIDGPRWHADAVVTDRPEVALFLPLGDCGGAVIYDKTKPILMLSHLGRHSTVQDGARKSVEFLVETFGSNPSDLKIWLSPGVGKDSYAMEAVPRDPKHHNFIADNRWRRFRQVIPGENKVYLDIPGYNRNGFVQAGVSAENIEISPIDTAQTHEYPSHSQGDAWRFAVAAMIRATDTPNLLH